MELNNVSPAFASVPSQASQAALRTFLAIAEKKWALNTEDVRCLLGGIGESTFFRWKKAPEQAHITHDTLERISYLLGIYKALALIYSDEAVAVGWLRRPNDNPAFGGQPPLMRLLAGNVADLYIVRQHLDARRGVWA